MRPELLHAALTFDSALALVRAHARTITRTEAVAATTAVGRVAAVAVVASADVPPFDRSAMDGYAVRTAAPKSRTDGVPVLLRCVDRVSAGDWPRREVHDHECVEIATGAPLPPGADAVVMVEHTSRDGDLVVVRESVRHGQNIGRRGGDISIGRTVLQPGHYITPARVGVLAALGIDHVEVLARPSVAIISTGSEVAAMGATLAPGHIRDVNAVTLSAIVAAHGGIASVQPPAPDAIDALVERLQSAARHDIIVCSGGSSVGSKDLLTDAMARCGRVHFHGIAVKPGKPTLFGSVGDTPLFGMPGNPTSCLSNAYLLLVPFLRAVAGLPRWQPQRVLATLATQVTSAAGRHQFYSVRLEGNVAAPAFKSSGDITSMADADGYIEIPAEVSILEAGTPVTVTLF